MVRQCLALVSCLGPVADFSPRAESFGVSAQIGSGVVRGGPQVRFHEGSTRVPRGFHGTKKSTACCWGYHQSLLGEPSPQKGERALLWGLGK